jgi:hypothetical protein
VKAKASITLHQCKSTSSGQTLRPRKKTRVSAMVVGSWFIVFNAPFNNISFISWRSVLLVEKTGVHGENH